METACTCACLAELRCYFYEALFYYVVEAFCNFDEALYYLAEARSYLYAVPSIACVADVDRLGSLHSSLCGLGLLLLGRYPAEGRH